MTTNPLPYRLLVEGAYKKRRLELEIGFEKRPRKFIEFDLPDSTELLVIEVKPGRTFGDNDEGTPCTVKLGKWSAPATFEDHKDYGMVLIGEAP